MKRIERVTALIEKEGTSYVALCPELDVASQGDSIEDAGANLEEAPTLFIETGSEAEIAERSHSEVYITGLDIAVG